MDGTERIVCGTCGGDHWIHPATSDEIGPGSSRYALLARHAIITAAHAELGPDATISAFNAYCEKAWAHLGLTASTDQRARLVTCRTFEEGQRLVTRTTSRAIGEEMTNGRH